MELRIVSLPEGSLSTESFDDKIIISTLRNISLNIVVLHNEFIHALKIRVTMELRAREQCALSLTSEYLVKNENMFVEKTHALKEIDIIHAQSSKLVAALQRHAK